MIAISGKKRKMVAFLPPAHRPNPSACAAAAAEDE